MEIWSKFSRVMLIHCSDPLAVFLKWKFRSLYHTWDFYWVFRKIDWEWVGQRWFLGYEGQKCCGNDVFIIGMLQRIWILMTLITWLTNSDFQGIKCRVRFQSRHIFRCYWALKKYILNKVTLVNLLRKSHSFRALLYNKMKILLFMLIIVITWTTEQSDRKWFSHPL